VHAASISIVAATAATPATRSTMFLSLDLAITIKMLANVH
jgi:hypothetical protein